MIYFVQSPDGGPIKIGTSIQLSRRLYCLNREAGCQLRVLAVMDGDREVEQSLHGRFSHLRVVNEWFDPGGDLIEFIGATAKPWDGIDEVPDERKPIVLIMRGSLEYKAFLERMAEFDGQSVAAMFDRAIRQYAKTIEFKESPPKR